MSVVTAALLRRGFPRAPQQVIDAFVAQTGLLARAGVSLTPQRRAFFFANLDHECSGFALAGLTENINYTARRLAEVWPNRFRDAEEVAARFGQAPGWQVAAFNEIYGNRMGNRPGTDDGSRFIGRGGPQITGREGYAEIGRRIGRDLVTNPLLASRLDLQPAIAAAFWDWKRLNRFADIDDFEGCVRAWNGGLNGLADRKRRLAAWRALLDAGADAVRAETLHPGLLAQFAAMVRQALAMLGRRKP